MFKPQLFKRRVFRKRPSDCIARRVDCLCDAGFPAGLAHTLAVDPRHDLHALLELAQRGCRPELAARILAPLDDHPAA